MLSYDTYHYAHIKHGEERTYANDMPLPTTKESEGKNNAQDNERRIYTNLYFREFDACYPTDSYR